MAAVIALLCEYPEHLVRRVCAATSGLPSRFKFFPAIAEIKAFCEERYKFERESEAQRAYRERSLGNVPGGAPQIAGPKLPPTSKEMPQEERDRITDTWTKGTLRPQISGEKDRERERQEAEAKLADPDWRRRMSLSKTPVTLGPALQDLIAKQQDPNYVNLESLSRGRPAPGSRPPDDGDDWQQAGGGE